MKRLLPLLLLSLGLAAHGDARAQVAAPEAFLVPAREARLLSPGLDSGIGAGALERILAEYSPHQAQTGDARVAGFLELESGSGLSLLCDSSLGIHSVLSDLAEHCLLGRLEGNNRFGLDPSTLGVRTQVLDTAGHGLDLSFGLSWLQPGMNPSEPVAGLDLFADRFAPSAGMLGALRGETLSLEGTRWLGERGWLRVTGSSGRYQFDHALPGIASEWRRSALSLQAGRGAFAGSLVGHRTETNLNSKAWFDFDLGLSWRTPWSGKLTVGANNVLNTPGQAADSDNRSPAAAEESRTPYVRYQQDL